MSELHTGDDAIYKAASGQVPPNTSSISQPGKVTLTDLQNFVMEHKEFLKNSNNPNYQALLEGFTKTANESDITINHEVEYMYLSTARHIHHTPGTENGLVQNLVAAHTPPQLLNPLLNAYVRDAEIRADGRNNWGFTVDEAAADAQIRVLREIQKGNIKSEQTAETINMQNYLENTNIKEPLNSYDPNHSYVPKLNSNQDYSM